MKTLFLATLFGFGVLAAQASWACDDFLAAGARNASLDARTRSLYVRDCAMQDRYVSLRSQFQSLSRLRISDVAEYKVLRFMNREAWEQAKVYQTLPNKIYNPAPATWDVWAGGLEQLFPRESVKGELLQSQEISTEFFSKINRVLLTDGRQSIKDRETDDQKQPGDFRHESDNNVAFCEPQSAQDFNALVESHRQSLLQVQKRAERLMGASFQSVFKKYKIDSFTEEQIGTVVRPLGPGCGKDGAGFLVSYVRSDQVKVNIERLKVFVKLNLEAYKNKKPLMPPTEFALFVQRWFVSIHPFADGNGRTSRALQDLLLADLDLPFAPTGDLRNDVLDVYDTYVESSYGKAESMLNVLDRCVAELKQGQTRSFACKTTHELNGY